jgi:hypothetical protein
MVVQAEPGAAGLPVQAGDDLGPVRPVAPRRQPRPDDHLVAVGGEDDRPVVARAAQDDGGAHGVLYQRSWIMTHFTEAILVAS